MLLDFGDLIAIAIYCGFGCPGDLLAILDEGLGRNRLRAWHSSAGERAGGERGEATATATSSHLLHLTEHAASSHASEAEVVVIVKEASAHAEASHSSWLFLLSLLLTLSSPKASAAEKVVIVVEEARKRVSSSEDLSEDVICLSR